MEKDVQDLRNAMKGAGTDEDTLIKITTKYNHQDRLKLRQKYKDTFGRDLIEDIKDDTSHNFQYMLVGLYTEPIEYDCEQIYKAIKGAGTDDDTLVEIIASRPGWYLRKIKQKYKEKYKLDLEEHVKGDTSGDYKKLLVSLLQCNRSTNNSPNKDECVRIAKELYTAGESKLGTDEPVFNKYFALLSPSELMTVAREYHKLYGNTLYKAIDKEFSRDIKNLLQTILYVLVSPSEYFATRLYKAIKGAGTDEKMLNRIIITRNEIDMDIMKQYFKQLYGKNLVEEVEDDVSGYYKKLITALINKKK